MPRDELAAGVLILSFAAWGTVHVHTAMSLLQSRPRWRGPVALVVAPLAPYWAARTGRRARAVAWLALLAIWLVARALLAR